MPSSRLLIGKLIFSSLLLLFLLFSSSTFAVSTDVKGFLALDAFSLEKIEGRRQSAELGIGHFDLKLFADYQDFHMRASLYLGRTTSSNFETSFLDEALLSWTPRYDTRLTFGKGRVPFHQRRRGVIDSGYISGGSILGTYHSLRDQKNKILITYRYGAFSKKFFNHLTFYGDTREPNTLFDDPSMPYLTREFGEITYRTRDNFNTKDQMGFANRFEWLPFRGLQVSTAALWYRRKIDPTPNYAFDISSRYTVGNMQYYAEYVWAFISTHPNDRFAAEKQYEQIAQLGGEYRLNRQWSLAFNLEAAWVTSQAHDKENYPNLPAYEGGYGQSFRNDGDTVRNRNQKIEAGVKRRWGRSMQISSGVIYERQQRQNVPTGSNPSTFQRVEKVNNEAYRFGVNVAFWY